MKTKLGIVSIVMLMFATLLPATTAAAATRAAAALNTELDPVLVGVYDDDLNVSGASWMPNPAVSFVDPAGVAHNERSIKVWVRNANGDCQNELEMRIVGPAGAEHVIAPFADCSNPGGLHTATVTVPATVEGTWSVQMRALNNTTHRVPAVRVDATGTTIINNPEPDSGVLPEEVETGFSIGTAYVYDYSSVLGVAAEPREDDIESTRTETVAEVQFIGLEQLADGSQWVDFQVLNGSMTIWQSQPEPSEPSSDVEGLDRALDDHDLSQFDKSTAVEQSADLIGLQSIQLLRSAEGEVVETRYRSGMTASELSLLEGILNDFSITVRLSGTDNAYDVNETTRRGTEQARYQRTSIDSVATSVTTSPGFIEATELTAKAATASTASSRFKNSGTPQALGQAVNLDDADGTRFERSVVIPTPGKTEERSLFVLDSGVLAAVTATESQRELMPEAPPESSFGGDWVGTDCQNCGTTNPPINSEVALFDAKSEFNATIVLHRQFRVAPGLVDLRLAERQAGLTGTLTAERMLAQHLEIEAIVNADITERAVEALVLAPEEVSTHTLVVKALLLQPEHVGQFAAIATDPSTPESHARAALRGLLSAADQEPAAMSALSSLVGNSTVSENRRQMVAASAVGLQEPTAALVAATSSFVAESQDNLVALRALGSLSKNVGDPEVVQAVSTRLEEALEVEVDPERRQALADALINARGAGVQLDPVLVGVHDDDLYVDVSGWTADASASFVDPVDVVHNEREIKLWVRNGSDDCQNDLRMRVIDPVGVNHDLSPFADCANPGGLHAATVTVPATVAGSWTVQLRAANGTSHRVPAVRMDATGTMVTGTPGPTPTPTPTPTPEPTPTVPDEPSANAAFYEWIDENIPTIDEGDKYGTNWLGGEWLTRMRLTTSAQAGLSFDAAAGAWIWFPTITQEEGQVLPTVGVEKFTIVDLRASVLIDKNHVIDNGNAENAVNQINNAWSVQNAGFVSRTGLFYFEFMDEILINESIGYKCGVGIGGDLLTDSDGEDLIHWGPPPFKKRYMVAGFIPVEIEGTLSLSVNIPYGIGIDFCNAGAQTEYFAPGAETGESATHLTALSAGIVPQVSFKGSLTVSVYLVLIRGGAGIEGTIFAASVPVRGSVALLYTDQLRLQLCHEIGIDITLLDVEIYAYYQVWKIFKNKWGEKKKASVDFDLSSAINNGETIEISKSKCPTVRPLIPVVQNNVTAEFPEGVTTTPRRLGYQVIASGVNARQICIEDGGEYSTHTTEVIVPFRVATWDDPDWERIEFGQGNVPETTVIETLTCLPPNAIATTVLPQCEASNMEGSASEPYFTGEFGAFVDPANGLLTAYTSEQDHYGDPDSKENNRFLPKQVARICLVGPYPGNDKPMEVWRYQSYLTDFDWLVANIPIVDHADCLDKATWGLFIEADCDFFATGNEGGPSTTSFTASGGDGVFAAPGPTLLEGTTTPVSFSLSYNGQGFAAGMQVDDVAAPGMTNLNCQGTGVDIAAGHVVSCTATIVPDHGGPVEPGGGTIVVSTSQPRAGDTDGTNPILETQEIGWHYETPDPELNDFDIWLSIEESATLAHDITGNASPNVPNGDHTLVISVVNTGNTTLDSFAVDNDVEAKSALDCDLGSIAPGQTAFCSVALTVIDGANAGTISVTAGGDSPHVETASYSYTGVPALPDTPGLDVVAWTVNDNNVAESSTIMVEPDQLQIAIVSVRNSGASRVRVPIGGAQFDNDPSVDGSINTECGATFETSAAGDHYLFEPGETYFCSYSFTPESRADETRLSFAIAGFAGSGASSVDVSEDSWIRWVSQIDPMLDMELTIEIDGDEFTSDDDILVDPGRHDVTFKLLNRSSTQAVLTGLSIQPSGVMVDGACTLPGVVSGGAQVECDVEMTTLSGTNSASLTVRVEVGTEVLIEDFAIDIEFGDPALNVTNEFNQVDDDFGELTVTIENNGNGPAPIDESDYTQPFYANTDLLWDCTRGWDASTVSLLLADVMGSSYPRLTQETIPAGGQISCNQTIEMHPHLQYWDSGIPFGSLDVTITSNGEDYTGYIEWGDIPEFDIGQSGSGNGAIEIIGDATPDPDREIPTGISATARDGAVSNDGTVRRLPNDWSWLGIVDVNWNPEGQWNELVDLEVAWGDEGTYRYRINVRYPGVTDTLVRGNVRQLVGADVIDTQGFDSNLFNNWIRTEHQLFVGEAVALIDEQNPDLLVGFRVTDIAADDWYKVDDRALDFDEVYRQVELHLTPEDGGINLAAPFAEKTLSSDSLVYPGGTQPNITLGDGLTITMSGTQLYKKSTDVVIRNWWNPSVVEYRTFEDLSLQLESSIEVPDFGVGTSVGVSDFWNAFANSQESELTLLQELPTNAPGPVVPYIGPTVWNRDAEVEIGLKVSPGGINANAVTLLGATTERVKSNGTWTSDVDPYHQTNIIDSEETPAKFELEIGAEFQFKFAPKALQEVMMVTIGGQVVGTFGAESVVGTPNAVTRYIDARLDFEYGYELPAATAALEKFSRFGLGWLSPYVDWENQYTLLQGRLYEETYYVDDGELVGGNTSDGDWTIEFDGAGSAEAKLGVIRQAEINSTLIAGTVQETLLLDDGDHSYVGAPLEIPLRHEQLAVGSDLGDQRVRVWVRLPGGQDPCDLTLRISSPNMSSLPPTFQSPFGPCGSTPNNRLVTADLTLPAMTVTGAEFNLVMPWIVEVDTTIQQTGAFTVAAVRIDYQYSGADFAYGRSAFPAPAGGNLGVWRNGYGANETVVISGELLDAPGEIFTDTTLRIAFDNHFNSDCESDLIIRVTNPIGVTEEFTPFLTCNGGLQWATVSIADAQFGN